MEETCILKIPMLLCCTYCTNRWHPQAHKNSSLSFRRSGNPHARMTGATVTNFTFKYIGGVKTESGDSWHFRSGYLNVVLLVGTIKDWLIGKDHWVVIPNWHLVSSIEIYTFFHLPQYPALFYAGMMCLQVYPFLELDHLEWLAVLLKWWRILHKLVIYFLTLAFKNKTKFLQEWNFKLGCLLDLTQLPLFVSLFFPCLYIGCSKRTKIMFAPFPADGVNCGC